MSINPLVFMYRGKETTVKEVCEEKGIKSHQFHSRYKAEGKPSVIDDGFFARIGMKSKTITLDGVPTRYTDIKRKLGVAAATISNRIKKHGRDLNTAMFAREDRVPKAKKEKAATKQPQPFTACF